MLNQHVFLLDEPQADARRNRDVALLPPKVTPSRDVFAEAILNRTSAHQRRSPLDWIMAILVHAVVLLVLLAAPLYFTQRLDLQKLNLTFLVAPTSPAAPAPPPAAMAAHRLSRSAPSRFTPGKLTVPLYIPKVIATSPSDVAPPEEAIAAVPGGVPGGLPGGLLGGQLGGVLGSFPTNVSSPVVASETPRKPLRVGGNVKPPRLLYSPEPDYPILARQARIGGIVVIDAIIDEHGNVVQGHVISGQPLLVQAALEAVSKRKFEPTILNGEPVPVELVVQVIFHSS
jgi:protein TonB